MKPVPHSTRLSWLFVLLVIALASSSLLGQEAPSPPSQDVADTIRVKTRVVFVDALVKDKRTGVPISDLKPEHFQILDDGNARPISYFTREGQARKPLALILILDLREDGAGRFLKDPQVLKTMADELAKLSPQDEIAILAMNIGEDEKRVWVSGFTRDLNQLVSALTRARKFIGNDEPGPGSDEHPSSLTLGASSSAPADKGATANTSDADPTPRPNVRNSDVVNVEVTKGKNGATTTRTMHKDGSIDIKRTNKKGNVTMEVGDVYDLRAAVTDALQKAKTERPNSQTTIVWVSDGITPVFFEDRDATEQMVVRSNVIFNSLTVEMRTLFKLLMPIGKPIAGMLGVSVYGSAKRLAQQSGGEAVKVSRTKDYATGLARIIGNLTARYSLGFALAESEQDDGKLHNLEVRVKAPDAKGKLRKLEVSSRRGYFMSEAGERGATATTAARTQ